MKTKIMPKRQENFQPVKPNRRGLFTKKAQERGMSVQEFAAYVKAHPDKFDGQTRLEANFAETAPKWNHSKK